MNDVLMPKALFKVLACVCVIDTFGSCFALRCAIRSTELRTTPQTLLSKLQASSKSVLVPPPAPNADHHFLHSLHADRFTQLASKHRCIWLWH
jgi:hypothetical protein